MLELEVIMTVRLIDHDAKASKDVLPKYGGSPVGQ